MSFHPTEALFRSILRRQFEPLFGWGIGERYFEYRRRLLPDGQRPLSAVGQDGIRGSLVAQRGDAGEDRPEGGVAKRYVGHFFPLARAGTQAATVSLPIELKMMFAAHRQQG